MRTVAVFLTEPPSIMDIWIDHGGATKGPQADNSIQGQSDVFFLFGHAANYDEGHVICVCPVSKLWQRSSKTCGENVFGNNIVFPLREILNGKESTCSNRSSAAHPSMHVRHHEPHTPAFRSWYVAHVA